MSEISKGLANGLTNYGDPEFAKYLRRSFAKSMGYTNESLDKPIVGICYTESSFNNCHRHFPEMLEAVKRGVLASGALPMPFPMISLGEVFLSPTSMVYRNLMAMAVEEMIQAQPMDAVVLMGGCDKTVPALLMGAVSAGKPAVMLVAGPMMTGRYKGERLGACTDCRRFWAQYRAGSVSQKEIDQIAESLGVMLPNTSSIPAVHADCLRASEQSGTVAAKMAIQGGPKLDQLITEESVENALRVLLSVSGSTNAIIHLTAIAGRAGVEVDLKRFNELSDETPVLVDLKPVGTGYMEDFHSAGGLDGVLGALASQLNLQTLDVTGQSLEQRLQETSSEQIDQSVIRTLQDPVDSQGGLIALHGTLAPGGAILKRAAATPALLEHEGRAVVFSSLEDLAARIDSPDLDVEAEDILVLQNAGPRSPSGMPEAGYLPIPKKLAKAGVKDMVRISDARMSGTAFGTIVLHVTPEADLGGPLALVQNGDRIRLSASAKTIDLLVTPEELEHRRSALLPSSAPPARGYRKLYHDTILPAPKGCDFDFLVPK